jgi:hypothetical protein
MKMKAGERYFTNQFFATFHTLLAPMFIYCRHIILKVLTQSVQWLCLIKQRDSDLHRVVSFSISSAINYETNRCKYIVHISSYTTDIV